MIPAFLVRVLVGSLLLTCAALAAERVAPWFGRPRRWIWAAVIGASVLLPVMSRWTPDFVGRNAIVGRSAQIIAVFEPPQRVNDLPQQSSHETTTARVPIDITRALELAWIGLSLTLFAFVAVAYRKLLRVRAASAPAEIDGELVLATNRTGPAVIGILHPAIIVPHWVMHVSADERRLIIMHEREHIDGRDPWLLAFATLATIAMPWNVVLWWQYRRLRLAIETDCDARVLARAGNCALYGRTLIRTAGDTVSLPMLAPGWGEAAAQLTQRILAMTARPPRARVALAGMWMLIAGALTLAACAATARPHESKPDTPRALAQGPQTAAREQPFALPGVGYVRVSGYTRAHLRTRVVLSGTGASFARDSGSVTIHGDTLEAITPVVFRVVTKGVPNYRLVAYAIEPGTEVEIDGVSPVGYGYPGAAGARGPYPMLNFTHDTLEAIPMPGATPLPAAAPPTPPTPRANTVETVRRRAAVPDEPRPPSNFDPGTIHVESESGDHVRVRISSNISFRIRGAGISSNRSDGTVEIVTPSNIVLTGTGGFAIVFEPVDPDAGIRVSADGRPEDGFVRSAAHGAMAIAVCSSPNRSGIQGAARGTLAPAVKCG